MVPIINYEGLPDTIFFDAVLRDFKADHPDFQRLGESGEGGEVTSCY